jgi:hypothetical protein
MGAWLALVRSPACSPTDATGADRLSFSTRASLARRRVFELDF